MKKHLFSIAIIGLATIAIAAVVLAQLRNISRQRTPKLTTEDVASKPAPRETGSKPIEPVGGTIVWQRDLDQAIDLARADNKLIIVDVYTDWCGWCKKMDQVIYSDPMIVGLSRQEVFLKFDAEDGSEGEQFARRMGVRGYPTTIILDSQGRKLKSAAGFLKSPQNFIKFVDSARASL